MMRSAAFTRAAGHGLCRDAWIQCMVPCTHVKVRRDCTGLSVSRMGSSRPLQPVITSSGRLMRLYTRAMQLEVDFFRAQPSTPAPRPIRSLVVDFDDTCTETDTISLFLDAAAEVADKAKGPAAAQGRSAAAVREAAKKLSVSYYTQYKAITDQLLSPEPVTSSSEGQPGTGVQGSSAQTAAYDPQGLAAFLDQLSDFDARMMQPVEDSGILAGLEPAHLESLASKVQCRPGCRSVLERAALSGLPTHVLSVNWSGRMIQHVLGLGQLMSAGLPPAYEQGRQQSTLQLLLPKGEALAAAEAGKNLLVTNDLEMEQGPGGETWSTGRVTRRVCTARDKAWAYAALAGSPGRGGSEAAVYVGDSPTDLAALLQADYGVVVGSSSSLRRVCRRYGVTLRPLVTAPLTEPPPAGVLYEAASWFEIEAFLFGPRSYEAHPYKERMQAVRNAWNHPPAAPHAPTPHQAPAANGHAVANGHTAANGHGTGEQTSANGLEGSARAPRVPVVLTIAGSDSGGGAGIQADLKAMQACGVFGTSALAAITAQNTHGVQAVHTMPLDVLAAQVDSVLSDIGAGAVKTGMLPTPEAVKLVADKVRQYGVRNLVVDPVMVSTSGHELAGLDVAQALMQHLLPLAQLVTPNLPEASVLLGGREIVNESDMCQAAKDLHAKLGCQAVLVKGGHLVGSGCKGAAATTTGADTATLPPDAVVKEQAPLSHVGLDSGPTTSIVSDVLYDGRELHVLRAPTIPCANTHGTGCTLASAIASYLARGLPVLPAVMQGKEYLYECLRHSTRLRIGTGVQRPFNHGWQIADWERGPSIAPPGSVSGGQKLVGRWAHQDVARTLTLYGVANSDHNAKHGRSMEEAVAAAIAGGTTIIQVREKECDGGLFLQRAAAALKVCRAAGVPLIINDRIDIALALGPDVGVHIGQADIPIAVARALLGPGRMLGVSVKTEEDAKIAVAAGADYLGVGAVYPTTTKVKTRVIGLDGLAQVAAAAHPVPIVAIGGIKEHHIAGVMASGAAGVAVVTAIFDQEDVTSAARVLRTCIDEAQRQKQLV